MASNFFAMISRLKYIDRWALMRNTHEENLSEHCMETACIAHALAVIGNRRFGKYYNAERAALLGLYHDAPETLTGDMPTPVKYYSPHIREAYAQVEQSACEHLVSMLPEDLRADFAPFFFKDETDEELWKLGVSAKTQHNEVAPAQHELAPIYAEANIAVDHNQIIMKTLKKVACEHGLKCLLHEKPFAGVNGSGKHNNWSLLTNTGINLFSPGPDPINNKPFLATLACAIKGVDEYAELLRLSAACAGNDHRLGANEAPPAIVSAFVGDDLNKVIKAIIDGEELNKTTCERFTTGVSVIPDFSKDSTDRNRTSPFAFTGNKFEFRMVGSSQSVAAVNTMLNAIMAEEYDQMAAKLDAGESLDDIIREFFKNHERIIFNGDGYSEEWKEEAARRGLPNHANSVDACACLKKPEIREMFVKHGVFTEAEIDSRYDIQLDNYAKTIRVEALTALSMAKTELYPAYVKACGTLANDAKEVAKAGVDNTFMVEDLKVLTSLLSTMREQMITLETAINKAESTDSSTLDTATAWKDLVIPAMDALRATADSLETKVSAQQYPIPNYIDLLFGI